MIIYNAYTKAGQLVSSYLSLDDAAENTGATKEHICHVISGKRKTAAKLKWTKEHIVLPSAYYGVIRCGKVYKALTADKTTVGYYLDAIDAAKAHDCYCVINNLNCLLNFERLRKEYKTNSFKYITKYKLKIEDDNI